VFLFWAKNKMRKKKIRKFSFVDPIFYRRSGICDESNCRQHRSWRWEVILATVPVRQLQLQTVNSRRQPATLRGDRCCDRFLPPLRFSFLASVALFRCFNGRNCWKMKEFCSVAVVSWVDDGSLEQKVAFILFDWAAQDWSEDLIGTHALDGHPTKSSKIWQRIKVCKGKHATDAQRAFSTHQESSAPVETKGMGKAKVCLACLPSSLGVQPIDTTTNNGHSSICVQWSEGAACWLWDHARKRTAGIHHQNSKWH